MIFDMMHQFLFLGHSCNLFAKIQTWDDGTYIKAVELCNIKSFCKRIQSIQVIRFRVCRAQRQPNLAIHKFADVGELVGPSVWRIAESCLSLFILTSCVHFESTLYSTFNFKNMSGTSVCMCENNIPCAFFTTEVPSLTLSLILYTADIPYTTAQCGIIPLKLLWNSLVIYCNT